MKTSNQYQSGWWLNCDNAFNLHQLPVMIQMYNSIVNVHRYTQWYTTPTHCLCLYVNNSFPVIQYLCIGRQTHIQFYTQILNSVVIGESAGLTNFAIVSICLHLYSWCMLAQFTTKINQNAIQLNLFSFFPKKIYFAKYKCPITKWAWFIDRFIIPRNKYIFW